MSERGGDKRHGVGTWRREGEREAGQDTGHIHTSLSTTQASLGRYADALSDAERTVALAPSWAKGYSRLGAALAGLGRHEDAVAAYDRGLEVDPSNTALTEGRAAAAARATAAADAASGAGAAGDLFGPTFWAKLAATPATAHLATDASFRALVDRVAADPAALTDALSDPRMGAAMQAVFGVSIQAGGGGEAAASPPPPPQPPAEPSPPPPEPTPEQTAAAEARAKAQAEKDAGNAAYKAKNFDTAIAHYTAAADLDPTDPTYLTNRAAAKLEAGDTAGALADCDAAVETGRAARADYRLIAKALARRGAAFAKAGDLEGAVAAYQKSLTEHRSADTLKKMQAAQKALKAATEAAYVDFGKADEEKEAGNAAFREARYPDAVKHYTEALARGPPGSYPDAHKLLSNRAACYTKLGAWADGVKDADACIALVPDFVKGYSRKGHLQFFSREYDKALLTYQAGLKVEPDNEELKDGVSRCLASIQKFNRGDADADEVAERQAKAMADPEVQAILTDPVMRQVLADFQDDPAAAARHSAQPEVMAKIQKLVAAGLVRVS